MRFSNDNSPPHSARTSVSRIAAPASAASTATGGEMSSSAENGATARGTATGTDPNTTSSRSPIPRELQQVLLEFTVQYLVHKPNDLLEFALDYFTQLKEKRGAMENDLSDESMISDEENEGSSYNSAAGRRKSVFAEAYNPEEDEAEERPIIYPKSDAQRRSLSEAVKGSLLFRSLEPEQLGEVLDAMFNREVECGDNIIEQGDDGDNFYVIECGTYNIYVGSGDNRKLVGNYEDEGSFGELALMYNLPRAATIQAVSKGVLWALDRATFRRIVLRTAFQKRKMYESLLEAVPLLAELSDYERMNLADALVSQSHPDGKVMVHQGAPGDGMYFVEDGQIEITMVGNDGTERLVTVIEKGGYFGELALLTHKPRAATAKAKGNVRVAFLDVQAFERLLGPCMDVMKRNIVHYKNQLIDIFGSQSNISDLR